MIFRFTIAKLRQPVVISFIHKNLTDFAVLHFGFGRHQHHCQGLLLSLLLFGEMKLWLDLSSSLLNSSHQKLAVFFLVLASL